MLRPLRVLRLVLPRPLRLVLPRPLRLLGAGRGARPSHLESDMATVTLTPLLLRTGGFTLTLPEPGTDCCMDGGCYPPIAQYWIRPRCHVSRGQHYTHTYTPHRLSRYMLDQNILITTHIVFIIQHQASGFSTTTILTFSNSINILTILACVHTQFSYPSSSIHVRTCGME